MTALLELTAEDLPQVLPESQISATITAYFAGLNSENYVEMAALFTTDGILFPPFEEAVVGPNAISQYLQAEAVGMRAFPKTYQRITTDSLDDENVLVRGRVQLPLFSVNVAWDFCLTSLGKIKSVRVDLLASLEELIKFRS